MMVQLQVFDLMSDELDKQAGAWRPSSGCNSQGKGNKPLEGINVVGHEVCLRLEIHPSSCVCTVGVGGEEDPDPTLCLFNSLVTSLSSQLCSQPAKVQVFDLWGSCRYQGHLGSLES